MKHHHIIGIIPARYGSSRFPGKPLVEILGKSLIQHTYESTKRCKELDELIVATDDQRIYDHVKNFGGNVVMTPVDCETGSDRLAFVLQNDPRLQKAEIIINVQGDEPCLDPTVISALIKALRSDPTAVMSTAVVSLDNEDEALSPSEVKCVLSLDNTVLYFSRSLIPGSLKAGYQKAIPYYKHLGIYAYRPDFLLKYAKLPMTPLQMAEDLEQLKVLENGYKIKAAIVKSANAGVNTPEDIKKVEQELCKQNTFS
ncbi:MAG TPA: 3-deoxy-manno-octulosonate cytidylyltransferase [Parachlamydiaceae bacterium]|nr:3-deoxy-manno-octulosonate cytidylyltransferase [Parachlamydiaceae bacterium]